MFGDLEGKEAPYQESVEFFCQEQEILLAVLL